MTTLGDLAQRLYTTFAETQELLEPKSIRFLPTRWDELPEWRQEVWVTVASEAVKAGVEIRQEIEQVFIPDNLIDVPIAEEDEPTRLRTIADQPRRFVRFRRDCE